MVMIGRLSEFFSRGCLDLNKLDVEDEVGVGRDDATGTARAIGVVRRAVKLCLHALSELKEGFIPAADDLTIADGEGQGIATIVT